MLEKKTVTRIKYITSVFPTNVIGSLVGPRARENIHIA